MPTATRLGVSPMASCSCQTAEWLVVPSARRRSSHIGWLSGWVPGLQDGKHLGRAAVPDLRYCRGGIDAIESCPEIGGFDREIHRRGGAAGGWAEGKRLDPVGGFLLPGGEDMAASAMTVREGIADRQIYRQLCCPGRHGGFRQEHDRDANARTARGNPVDAVLDVVHRDGRLKDQLRIPRRRVSSAGRVKEPAGQQYRQAHDGQHHRGSSPFAASFRGSDPQNSMVAPFQAKRQSRNGT